jgi:hypothetical protein
LCTTLLGSFAFKAIPIETNKKIFVFFVTWYFENNSLGCFQRVHRGWEFRLLRRLQTRFLITGGVANNISWDKKNCMTGRTGNSFDLSFNI